KYVRPYEISVEVSPLTLRRYGISLADVAAAIRASSLDIPGGAIKTEGGEILLRTRAQAYTGREFEQVVVLTQADGTRITLDQIATVVDGFEDSDLRARFDNQPAVVVEVRRVGEEDILAIAAKVKAYIEAERRRLPDGVTITVWKDESQDLVDRLDVLSSNAVSGLALVLLVLTLFLQLRLALWVALSIPVAVLGTVMLFPLVGISISTLAVLGFILVLGILVDDAIVVGERVYAHRKAGKDPLQAAIDGTHEVAVPVIFGVMTTIATFLPIMAINVDIGPFFTVIGAVVIIALIISVVESQLILPAHLAYHGFAAADAAPAHGLAGRWSAVQARIADTLEAFARDYYQPALERALAWRYLTLAIGLGVVLVVLGLLLSGRIIFQFFPSVDGSRIYAVLSLPEGTPIDITERGVRRMEAGALALQRELDSSRGEADGSILKHMMSSIGAPLAKGSIDASGAVGPHFAEVGLELDIPADYSGMPPAQIAARWRELTGPIADAVELSFTSAAFDAGAAIDIQLRGPDFVDLQKAATRLREALGRYAGVVDITDTFRSGKQEVQLALLPEARNLGLTVADLGEQVRQAFYGAEAQRVQRGKDDVKVMVRFPEAGRRSLADLENMRIRTPGGVEVPFLSVARMEIARGFSAIKREDGARIIRVIADVNRQVTTPEEVLAAMQQTVLADIERDFPRIDARLAGEAEERAGAMASLARNSLMALLLIYALLAIPLRSYLQPLVIMSAIPFGAIGAVIGHWLIGEDLVFFSLLGIVALSGVVVNASLVLVDFINKRRADGVPIYEAVSHAGQERFRPIVLTSLTTFVGLVPLISTPALAVKFFMAMAVSLAFGVLIATTITLFLVPSLYLILDDATRWWARRWAALRSRRDRPQPSP
ncbi:MAG: efflux RND transporter permease subunit, partial [Spongiibacteraceae bacterium]|nr:efflux RND transporter permease subunit [Spongiibacteraceae bacterium]